MALSIGKTRRYGPFHGSILIVLIPISQFTTFEQENRDPEMKARDPRHGLELVVLNLSPQSFGWLAELGVQAVCSCQACANLSEPGRNHLGWVGTTQRETMAGFVGMSQGVTSCDETLL